MLSSKNEKIKHTLRTDLLRMSERFDLANSWHLSKDFINKKGKCRSRRIG